MISQWRTETPLKDIDEDATFARIFDFWDDQTSFIENMMKTDINMYLPDDILVKIDRAMSHGLETRVPLDERVIKYAWQIPIKEKLVGKKGKVPLRKILNKYIPYYLIDRPKQGFGVPIDSWLRGPLKDWASDLLDVSKLKKSTPKP